MKKYIKLFIFLFICGAIIYSLKFAKHFPKNMSEELPADFFGVTYSKKYAENIGLDWKDVYLKVLDDLKIKYIRIPVYWDDVEKIEGEFDFSDYVFMIEEGEKRGIEFILSLGMRAPRWPECHIPDWVDLSDSGRLRERLLIMIGLALDTFKDYESIAYLQIENEPLLNTFGVCPKADENFLKEELAFVKSMDNRPIMVTATGELSLWHRESELADVFGTTMYRVVHNSFLGYIRYPYSEGIYKSKARALKLDPNKVFIAELQAEPWINLEQLLDVNSKEYLKSFDLNQFRANLRLAANTGFKRAYLWGVEWWYFRDLKANDSSYLDLAKELIR